MVKRPGLSIPQFGLSKSVIIVDATNFFCPEFFKKSCVKSGLHSIHKARKQFYSSTLPKIGVSSMCKSEQAMSLLSRLRQCFL